MRLSPQRHTLAVLRTIIGIPQKEMAEILECSTATVQAIELGKLKLSEKLARNLVNQTAVSLAWLLQDDVTKPPVDFQDKPHTRDTFEKRQATLFAPPEDSSDVRRDLFYARARFRQAVDQLAILFTHAYREDRVQMCAYKVSDALWQLMRAHVNPAKLTPQENERSRELHLHAYKPEDLLAPVRRFLEDTDAIFQKQIEDFEPTPPGGKHPISAKDLPAKFPKVSSKKGTAQKKK